MVEDKADDESGRVNIGDPGLPPSVTDADITRSAGGPVPRKSKDQHVRELEKEEHERRMEQGKECKCELYDPDGDE